MSRRDLKLRERKPIHRYSFAFLGFVFVVTGVLNLLMGRLQYRNYWGAPVFTPFAIFIGILLVTAGLLGGAKGNR